MTMEPSERKRRDLLERETLFLDKARLVLLEAGYHGLTMGRVAQETGYSRGTIYQHFTCKEDLIVALVKRSMERRLALLERAATFRGRPRERLVALGRALELFPQFYRDDVRIFFIGNTEAITQKASERLLWEMQNCALRSLNIPIGIVRDAIALGDLVLKGDTKPEEIAYNFWAMTDGAYETAYSGWLSPAELGIAQPVRTAIAGCQVLCDGYGWQPLSGAWDYEATRRRVFQEFFVDSEERKRKEVLPGLL